MLALHFLLLVFESQFAFWPSLSGILAHGAYIYLLREWPYVDLWSAGFAGTCVLLLLDHYLWFQAFTQYYIEFERVLAIFVLCVWLVPFMYLVSLSAPDSTLPYGIVSACTCSYTPGMLHLSFMFVHSGWMTFALSPNGFFFA